MLVLQMWILSIWVPAKQKSQDYGLLKKILLELC